MLLSWPAKMRDVQVQFAMTRCVQDTIALIVQRSAREYITVTYLGVRHIKDKLLEVIMKKFEKPQMAIREFGTDEIIRTSGCQVEVLACLDCYCTSVDCDSKYSCTSERCPILHSL